MFAYLRRTCAVPAVALLLVAPAFADPSQEQQSLLELRNTVVNLLQALVDRGVMTREQAETLIKNAQEKAATDAAALAQKQKAEENAVRVPYVPEVVREEIRKEVVADLGPSIKKEVVNEVSSEGSLRSALPEWVQRMTWTGDVRVRGEGDQFGHDNATNTYLDFNAVNSKGGIDKAGIAALLNTTEDRDRLRLRLRFGFDTDLGAGFSAGMRLATGSGEIFATTNQTEGVYGQGYAITVDQGFVRWTGESSTGRQVFTSTLGRFGNPYLGTDLMWYNDLTFEGLASTYRLNLSADNSHRHDLFATVGAYPLQDATPSSADKWLAAGQIGADLHTEGDSRLRIGAAYYDYIHIVGQRNAPNSTLLNYTAPVFVQKGNTIFDISNSTDPTVNLFGLAANFRVADVTLIGDWHVTSAHSVGLVAEALKNIGFKAAEVEARTGTYVAPRTRGYRLDLGFGSAAPGAFGTWRTTVGYRYLERDAVVDAFNDEDFHLGGTDTKGYTAVFDWWINPRVWTRMKYMSGNAIDGPPLTIDVWQLDLNTRF